MKSYAVALSLLFTGGAVIGQTGKESVEAHVAAAKAAAGQEHSSLLTPDRPDRFWFETYEKSASRFRNIVSKAGADIILSNHTNTDGSKKKLPALAKRKAGDTHPYVIGK
jgi:hypothetical protein